MGPGVKSTHWLHRPCRLLMRTSDMPLKANPCCPPPSRQEVRLKVNRPVHSNPFNLSDSLRSSGCISSTANARHCLKKNDQVHKDCRRLWRWSSHPALLANVFGVPLQRPSLLPGHLL